MYEFVGQNPGVVRGGEVQFQVSEFFEPIGMFQRHTSSILIGANGSDSREESFRPSLLASESDW